jgi:hypothetical protein
MQLVSETACSAEEHIVISEEKQGFLKTSLECLGREHDWQNESPSPGHATSTHDQTSTHFSAANQQSTNLPVPQSSLEKRSNSLVSALSHVHNVIVEAALVSAYPKGSLDLTPGMLTTLRNEAENFDRNPKVYPERSLTSAAAMYALRFAASSPVDKFPLDGQLPADIVRLCRTLHMHGDAAAGWCKMSETPCVFLVSFFIFQWLTLLGFGCMFTLGLLRSPWFPYIVIPAGIYGSVDIFWFGMFWRYGPVFAWSRLFTNVNPFVIVQLVFLILISHVVPDIATPFGSKPAYTVALFASFLTLHMSCLLGREPYEQPLRPYKSLVAPLVSSAIRMVRLMDALTDVGIVHLLSRKVCFKPIGTGRGTE